MKLDLNLVKMDERVLKKSEAQFKGRVLKDKDGKVELQLEREKATIPLESGQQCVLVLQSGLDKAQFISRVILDLLVNVLGGYGADGRPSKQLGIAEMGPYTRIIEAFRASDGGVVDLSAEDINYLSRKFSAVALVPSPKNADLFPVVSNINSFLSREAQIAKA